MLFFLAYGWLPVVLGFILVIGATPKIAIPTEVMGFWALSVTAFSGV